MSSLIDIALIVLSVASTVYPTPLSTPPTTPPTRSNSPITLAPLVVSHHPHGTINNSYIVVFKPDTPPHLVGNHFNFLQIAHAADPLVAEAGTKASGVQQVYNGHLNGYAGLFTEGVVQQLRTMPEVDYIEADQVVKTMDLQKSAPWGLSRISHRSRLTFGTLGKYTYDSLAGTGVDVYVIDTGINIHHTQFSGRASWGKTIPPNDVDEDGNGHGSHCAGTIASTKYGVAKGANVIAVKVLGSNGSGSMSDVVGGVDWAAREAVRKAQEAEREVRVTGKTAHKGSVANMSLGGGKSKALDDIVNKAVDSGLHFAVAAGNDNRDACSYSPAGAEKAVTVGASTIGDERAYFSNYGPCVDVFGPGLNILSTYKGGPNATATLSGTSMASPHTAGLLAYLLSIYPSEAFDPSISEDVEYIPLSLVDGEKQRMFGVKGPSVYALMHASLPRWISGILPPPKLFSTTLSSSTLSSSSSLLTTTPFLTTTTTTTTPTPRKPLTPAQLKKALLALATKGALGELPGETPNLLIFNNATGA